MESRGLEDFKNVKISQAYFFEGFISFFEDFSLTTGKTERNVLLGIRGNPKDYHFFCIRTKQNSPDSVR